MSTLRKVLVDADGGPGRGVSKTPRFRNNAIPFKNFFRSGDLSMSGFYMWGAIAALGFLAAVTLISRPEQMLTNVYVLTICLVAGALQPSEGSNQITGRLCAHTPYLRDRRSGSCESRRSPPSRDGSGTV